jgi:hypothetical protein
MRRAIVSVLILSGSLFASSAVFADTLSGRHRSAGQMAAVRIPQKGFVVAVSAYPTISKSEAAMIARNLNAFAVRGDRSFIAADDARFRPFEPVPEK